MRKTILTVFLNTVYITCPSIHPPVLNGLQAQKKTSKNQNCHECSPRAEATGAIIFSANSQTSGLALRSGSGLRLQYAVGQYDRGEKT